MLSDDSDVEHIHTLTINEHFAKAFEYRKQREELAKLKEKYGSDADEDDNEGDEDSEEGVSEDEDGEELTLAMDAAILRTLARIKRKDPSIYESQNDVFEEERQRTGEVALSSARPHKDKSKPLTIRQHALASALADADSSRSPSPEPLTHVQEQKMLRKETIAAFHTAVDGPEARGEDNDDEEDDLLVLREKTKDEIEREEEEYRTFLQREVGEDLSELITIDAEPEEQAGIEEQEAKTSKKSKKPKRKKSAKTKQANDQEFLMNYILNRGWIDRSERRPPTYKEITSSTKGKGRATALSDAEDTADAESNGEGREQKGAVLDEDEFDEVADRFESTYNFRYEEPDASEIARHPRNLSSLVRRQDTTRKEAREKRKTRKEEELLKKKEEVKRLKALKMKELRAKLERIGAEGGKKLGEDAALQALDLDADWDPDAHDRQMADLYDIDGVDGGEDQPFDDDEKPTWDDDEKPMWDDDIDIADIVPLTGGDADKTSKKKKKKKGDADGMDDGAVNVDEMDAEVERVDVDVGDEEWDGTEEMRKRKVEEYMDELYGMDFNDMVAGMPTRFHYMKVEPQSFGLTPAEILMATDAELNTYMGIKKYAPYRKEGKGRTWDSQRSTRLQELKGKLRERGVDGTARWQNGGEGAEKVKKRKGKKERMREKTTAAAGGEDNQGGEESGVEEGKVLKKKRKRKEETGDDSQDGQDLAKKKRRRHKKSAAAS